MQNQTLQISIQKACNKIAPVWPLKNSVAVNPYVGLAESSFKSSANLLAITSGIDLTMPFEFYLNKIESKEILYIDLYEALKKNQQRAKSIDIFIDEIKEIKKGKIPLDKGLTVIDAAEELSGKSWNEFMVDEVSAWASAYFDEDQALWKTSNSNENIFEAWKQDAEVNLSPKWMGLKKFIPTLKQISNNQDLALSQTISRLGIKDDIAEIYSHTLLMRVLGWSSYVSGIDFNNGLYDGGLKNVESFLAIILCWELCLYENFKETGIDNLWISNKESLEKINSEGKTNSIVEYKVILQDAYDFACQRDLKYKFSNVESNKPVFKRPKVQAIFCIDVRSEVYRRNLESVDNLIDTIGFAGFFGFPINYFPIANDKGKNQCPVLIPSGPIVKETLKDKNKLAKATTKRRVKHQINKTFKTFKSGPVSSFSFVSPLGIFYLPKLISNAFGWTRPSDNPDIDGLGKDFKSKRQLDLSNILLDDKVNMATSALTAMGLKDNFAPLVLINGHGSTSVNNPHATGLDCGACGGHSGEINAMTAEGILNDVEVRKALRKNGIDIPKDTHFVAGLHNTTSDEIEITGELNVPESHTQNLKELKSILKQASIKSRLERSLRFNMKSKNIDTAFEERGNDWAQVRPEWGLAGCNSFIIAPRNKTAGINLQGKSFLHSYEWKKDTGFNVLEAIMTAPMVVTSWINLQYYASLTDNKRMGSGNKTLHNVTGGLGVLEGGSGDLRIGLPWQSLFDGENYQHLPQRLSVIIDAPIEEINKIIKKHSSIQNLVDNDWIFILSLDEHGKINARYNKNLEWDFLNHDDILISELEKEMISI